MTAPSIPDIRQAEKILAAHGYIVVPSAVWERLIVTAAAYDREHPGDAVARAIARDGSQQGRFA